MWSVGVLAYAIAVFQRSSLGVAGPQAQQRFGLTAATLSLLAVAQLATYAALQVPAGVLLDRFGSRRMITTGALVMAAGQFGLATAHGGAAAVGARLLVGAGDAITFISVLRLVPAWFAPRQVPMVTQVTAILGQVGQIVAAFPLLALLGRVGWTRSFTTAAALGVLAAVLVAVVLRDAPLGAVVASQSLSLGEVRRRLGHTWREPGTRIGLWTHFVTQFSGNTFALLWGYPFLTHGEGLRPVTAGLLLTLLVLAGMVVGPALGQLAARWPMRRSALVFLIVGSSAVAWAVVLAWPGRSPLPVLVVLVLVLASNGPGSMIGFDFARSFNPRSRLGSASGIVNVGGFVATLLTMLGVGVVLDLVSGNRPGPSLGAYKAAFAVQYVLWAIGLAAVIGNRRILRRRLRDDDGVIIEPLHRAVARRLRSMAP
ncbi:MAG: MFS transporter [Pseudonocardiales bacterium]|nr:MAG: MFS transporter [Pseudonocardiales bacterium]